MTQSPWAFPTPACQVNLFLLLLLLEAWQTRVGWGISDRPAGK